MFSPEKPRSSASSSTFFEALGAALHEIEVEQLIAHVEPERTAFIHVHGRTRGVLDPRTRETDSQD